MFQMLGWAVAAIVVVFAIWRWVDRPSRSSTMPGSPERAYHLHAMLPQDERAFNALSAFLISRNAPELADFHAGLSTVVRGYDATGIDARDMMMDQLQSLSLMPDPAVVQLRSLSINEIRRLLLAIERF